MATLKVPECGKIHNVYIAPAAMTTNYVHINIDVDHIPMQELTEEHRAVLKLLIEDKTRTQVQSGLIEQGMPCGYRHTCDLVSELMALFNVNTLNGLTAKVYQTGVISYLDHASNNSSEKEGE